MLVWAVNDSRERRAAWRLRIAAASAIAITLSIWVGAFSVPKASALVADPLTNPAAWLDGVWNGGGAAITDFLDGAASLSNLTVDGMPRAFGGLLFNTAEVGGPAEIAEAGLGFGTVTLGAGLLAFGVLAAGGGVYMYLHYSGDVGTRDTGPLRLQGMWKFVSNMQTYAGGGLPAQPGAIFYPNEGSTFSYTDPSDPCLDSTGDEWGTYGHLQMSGYGLENLWRSAPVPCTVNGQTTYWNIYERYMTAAQFDAAFGVDVMLPYSGQAHAYSIGWGLTSWGAARSYPSTSGPIPQCRQDGGVVACAAVSPSGGSVSPVNGWSPAWVNPDGTMSQAADPNNLRCQVDPAAYFCPTPTSDGTNWQDVGGAAGPMPDCYGLSVADCEAAVIQTRPDASFTLTTASGADPNVADGLVVATTPIAATDPTPSPVQLSQNPDTGNPVSCEWKVQNPHESTGTPGAVDVKATALCDYQTEITASLTLWKCAEQPSADLTALNKGDWGCGVAATSMDNIRLAMPGTPETFQAPEPGGATITPDNMWFIAYGTLDKGSPPSAFSTVVQLP